MKKLILSCAAIVSLSAFAEDGFLDRPSGIKIGNRLTLRPYVSFSYTFDTNPDYGRNDSMNASYWTANPGINAVYDGGNWKINGTAYYMYHAFTSGCASSLNNDSYGEQLGYSWSNIANRGPGWSLLLSERFARIDQNDDFTHGDGKGLWRNRQQFDASFVAMRRFNEFLYSSVNASYYWLDYSNDAGSYAPLYGWDRWTVGLEVGYGVCEWADVFVAGGYQRYAQDGSGSRRIANTSDGWTVHAGITGEITEKLSYRLSGGVSTFEYGDASTCSGFTYEGSLKWNITRTLMTSLLASSYYHPSERSAGSATRCDSISWGIAKSMVRNKLNATFDIAYRHDTHCYTSHAADDWELNLLTARLGVNYVVNRLITVFARGEFQTEMNDGSEIRNHYDHNRLRGTVGVKLTY